MSDSTKGSGSSHGSPHGSFHGFVGQHRTVQHLLMQLHGSQTLGQSFPHMLVTGPSGMGKTKLIKALAREAGVDCRVVHGKASISDLCDHLVCLSKGDFILFDEAHTLPRASQEALYEVIDTGYIQDKLSAAGAYASTATKSATGKLAIQPCTICLASNLPSGILEAMKRRMDLTVVLQNYTPKELIEIAQILASNTGLLFDPGALKLVARASQGRPYKIVQFVSGIRLLLCAEDANMHKKEVGTEEVLRYLKSTGRNKQGMDHEQRQYLKHLYCLGSRASLSTLASLVGLEDKYLEDAVEMGLIKLGYIQRASGGRKLTIHGEMYVRKAFPRLKQHRGRLGGSDVSDRDGGDTSTETMGPPIPVSPSQAAPNTAFGYPLTKLFQWAGKNGWGFERMVVALSNLSIVHNVKEATLRTAWSDGKNPKYCRAPNLPSSVVEELEKAADA